LFKISGAFYSVDQVWHKVGPALVITLNIRPFGFHVLIELYHFIVPIASATAKNKDEKYYYDQYEITGFHFFKI
jgi:hypothetical protein